MSQARANRSQIRQIMTLAGKAGIKDRTQRMQLINEWVTGWYDNEWPSNDPIGSTTELTVDEAALVIARLKNLLLVDDDTLPVPPPPPPPRR